MAQKTRPTLKTYFEAGDVPSQTQYADLIDSQLNLQDISTQIVSGTVSASYFIAEKSVTSSNMLVSHSFNVGNNATFISASNGSISASGIIYAEHFHSDDDAYITDELIVDGLVDTPLVINTGEIEVKSIGNNVVLKSTAESIQLKGNSSTAFTFDVGSTPEIDVTGDLIIDPSGGDTIFDGNVFVSGSGNITASSDISASGTITAGKFDFVSASLVLASITASGNISSSANIVGNNITASGAIKATGDITSSGNMYSALLYTDDIRRRSSFPTTTRIYLGEQNINTYAGHATSPHVTYNATEGTVFNTDGYAGWDFRVEGDTNAHLLYIDAGNDTVSIGTPSIGALLTVGGNIHTTSHITASGNISASGENHVLGKVSINDGHITASGNISSSGTIYANNFESTGGHHSGVTFHDDISLTGSITASGVISASVGVDTNYFTLNGVAVGSSTDTFWVSASSGQIYFNNNNVGINILYGQTPGERLTVGGNISASGYIYAGTASIDGPITASGNISSSETIYANQLILPEGSSGQFHHITASGDISASGTVYADNFQSTGGDVAGISFTDDLNITGHITASGNISASGTIYADNFGSSGGDDTVSFVDKVKIAGTTQISGSEYSGSVLTSLGVTGSILPESTGS